MPFRHTCEKNDIIPLVLDEDKGRSALQLGCFILWENAPWLGAPYMEPSCLGLKANLLSIPGIKLQLLQHPTCRLVTILNELAQFQNKVR